MKRLSQHNVILDNAKFILIFLVILGHSFEPFIKEYKVVKTIYLLIYSFHMPAFVMISGMLSRKLATDEFKKKLVKRLLVPFLVFTFIYEAFHFIAFNEVSKYIYAVQPHWLLWFLPSLFVWRYTLDIVNKTPGFLYISIFMALFIGLFPSFDNLLGLSRTIYFWPFFLIGAHLTTSYNEKLPFNFPRLLWGFALVAVIFLFWHINFINQKILYGYLAYLSLGPSQINGLLTQTAFIILATLMCFIFLNLTPKKIGIPTHWKQNTLYVYLWHGLAIKAAVAIGLATTLERLQSPVLIITLVLGSIVLTALFSSTFVKTFTDKFLLQPVQKLIP